jgi:Cu/Ag efflux protein CusF
MRKLWLALTLTALTALAGAAASAQVTPAATSGATRATQQHLVGEVTAVDAATHQLTVKTDAGANVTVTVDERTIYRRVPPGQTSLENAERITSADVSVGDRVLVPNGLAGGQTAARQVIVMARAAVAAKREQEREDWRARGVSGRITAIDAAKKELTVEARSREGAETVTVAASAGNVRFRRYAAGSLRPADAVAGSFADIRVGDQARVLGKREGSRVTAEEIISGTVARLSGVVEAVDAQRGEVTVKENQTGRTVTVSLLANSMVRRIPAEYAETLRQREERRNAAGAGNGQSGERRERRRERDGQGGQGSGQGQSGQNGERQRAGGGGRGAQGMFENMPALTIAELKKGDAVMITGTAGADAQRVTAATFITGDADIIQRLQRFQRGRGQRDNMSPGLPGNVVGGGTGDREQP